MRKINEIIIHCTATPDGRAVTVADIDRWHHESGIKGGIGYHYLIDLNGKIWAGRDECQIGAHCKGHNANSIGVCYVGGCDRLMRSADTRTPAQIDSLTRLISELKRKYPQASVHGHYEFAAKDCPCFDVQKWLKEVGL